MEGTVTIRDSELKLPIFQLFFFAFLLLHLFRFLSSLGLTIKTESRVSRCKTQLSNVKCASEEKRNPKLGCFGVLVGSVEALRHLNG